LEESNRPISDVGTHRRVTSVQTLARLVE
jgi:hypothetical protein